ncbi:phosphotransferase [Pseudovibrio sp. Tun.PSC04-5.I4]|uniref:phosphotransferase n=1 Tax=Pseudovibrio sp. Tun.PSC04-5.I4 TaxID=1798213 RepID=UPI00088DBFBB|nr:phosphotransferase [Pseudovibrio sp. Tun.PSC04-5.I4]SDQ29373.1 Phosphotransferase enzyme family protein [Pseudovibrio sp. Tun.PSC04-5.I4]
MNIRTSIDAMNQTARPDASLKVWRLDKHGALMAGFSDAIISISPQDCAKRALTVAALDMLGGRTDELAIPPASTTILERAVIMIYPRGEPAISTPDSCAAAIKLLKGLHSVEVTNPPKILVNPFLVDGRYCPLSAWDSLFARRVTMLPKQTREAVLKTFKMSCESFNRSTIARMKGCLIHGDVQFGNMVRLDGTLRLIDWEDARIDHPLIDLAQFLFVNAIPQSQIREVIRAYDPALTTEDLLLFGYLNYLWTCFFMQENQDLMQAARTWAVAQNLPEALCELSEDQKTTKGKSS